MELKTSDMSKIFFSY